MSNYCQMSDCYIDKPHEHRTVASIPVMSKIEEQEQRIAELELKLSVLEPDNKQLFSDNNAQAIRLSEQEQRIAELEASKPAEGTLNDAQSAYEYLVRLLKTVAPQCEPLPSLLGIATQIDNYIAGLRPAEGTWQWALEQMKAGKRVRRECWSRRQSYLFAHTNLRLLVCLGNPNVWDDWATTIADFEATDWRLAPPATEPEEE